MRYPERVTMCVSSQAGCGMACPFCATGQAGLTRNLSTAEIVEQVVRAPGCSPTGRCPAGPPRLQIVFMGMGEPLANYGRDGGRTPDDRSGPRGLGISQRSVTVSTVGLVPAIAAHESIPVTLALSLHAPDDGCATSWSR